MTDAQKIAQLRLWLAALVKHKSEAHAGGARFHLLDSASLIDTLAGYLNGAPMAGVQAGDSAIETIGKAISGGAPYAIGGTGYSTVERSTR